MEPGFLFVTLLWSVWLFNDSADSLISVLTLLPRFYIPWQVWENVVLLPQPPAPKVLVGNPKGAEKPGDTEKRIQKHLLSLC